MMKKERIYQFLAMWFGLFIVMTGNHYIIESKTLLGILMFVGVIGSLAIFVRDD
jgi:multisubunit Na+/H+ antiporter MnhF subunit